MLEWCVYFLQLSNGDIYVGSSNDLKRRFASHQAGQVLSTKAYLPAVLKSYIAVETAKHARELESYLVRFRKSDRSQEACEKKQPCGLIQIARSVRAGVQDDA